MEHFDLDTFLPYHMNVATSKLINALYPVYKVYGIDVPQWRIICHLGGRDGRQDGRRDGQRDVMVSARHIRTLTCLEKVPFSRAIARLEQKQWICRHTNPNDHRHKDIMLTNTGRNMYEKITLDVSVWYENLISELGKDTVDTLIKNSKTIVAKL